MTAQMLSPYLDGLGISGTIMILIATAIVVWRYRDSRMQGFRWRLRNWRLMQLSAIACLFFLAMAASYGVLQEAWGWLYLIVAFKVGTWWLRYSISRRV
jgi:hypothetical protein